MKELSLVLKDNDIISIDGKYQVYNITSLPNSKITINEYNNSDYIINLEAGSNSTINYISVSLKNALVKRNIKLNRGSSLELNVISMSDVLDNTIVDLIEEHSNASINYLCVNNNGKQDINTTINHNDKHTNSLINNVGVAFDNANILFNTTGFVAKGNNGCDCRQLSKGVIVGEKSKVTSRPILLIDEYDVKAYHGATIGKMSDAELFYLMSRGLTKKEAFILILDGLVDPILSKVLDIKLKEEIKQNISKLLGD
ncbi:MAG: SufB/SufD family protein [Anaeroplasmataceae bacterium]